MHFHPGLWIFFIFIENEAAFSGFSLVILGGFQEGEGQRTFCSTFFSQNSLKRLKK